MGIILTDEHGEFKKANPGFLSLINMPQKDLLKENFFKLCHPEDYFVERKQLDRLLRKELESVGYEIRLINNDGKTFVCSVQSKILWTKPDVFESFVFVLREIS
jgi:PAS domain S-box-containing protein